jgi:single-strand DNA-binding protein
MANLNRVLLIGNLTRDPELRVTPKGTAICQFGLAISRSFKDESGQVREEATFVDVEAWGKQGETIAKFCTKGRPLFVEGRLRFDQWEDKTTQQKRNKLKVVLENFQFLGSREGGAPTPGAPGGSPMSDEGMDQTVERPAATPAPRAPGGTRPAPAPQHDINDEDVPF